MSVTSAGTTPKAPAVSSGVLSGARTAGLDWSNTEHVVCVLDGRGAVVHRFHVGDDKAGLGRITGELRRLGVDAVGIERGQGPVVDALLDAGLTVLVIPPAQVKNLRSRYGSAGNKDDRFDAFVLADVARTDRARLTPLEPQSAHTTVLQEAVRARRDLTSHRVAATNQLLAHLQRTLPGALGLFNDLHSTISLDFLESFPTQVEADLLTEDSLACWLAEHHQPRAKASRLIERLRDAVAGLSAPGAREHAAAAARVTRSYVAVIKTLNEQITALHDTITAQHETHPDRALFAALPRTATLRQARLIAELGDARGRFPTAQSLACLAGVVPSTRRSGKSLVVAFRWAVNHELRDAICDFAGDSRFEDPWAADYYNRARARGHDHNHAVRILARAWVDIIWRCWHDHIPYDPARHNALQHILNNAKDAAA